MAAYFFCPFQEFLRLAETAFYAFGRIRKYGVYLRPVFSQLLYFPKNFIKCAKGTAKGITETGELGGTPQPCSKES